MRVCAVDHHGDEVFVATERDAMLAPDETEPIAEFENAVAQPADRPVFEFGFLDLLLDTRKFQVVGAFECLLGLLG